MTLIDGKFFRGFEEVKPEFGNKEQIALIRETEKRVSALNNEGLVISAEHEIVYTASLQFLCVCGQHVWKEDDDARSRTDISGLVGICKCMRCSKRYEVTEKKGDLIVKLIEENP